MYTLLLILFIIWLVVSVIIDIKTDNEGYPLVSVIFSAIAVFTMSVLVFCTIMDLQDIKNVDNKIKALEKERAIVKEALDDATTTTTAQYLTIDYSYLNNEITKLKLKKEKESQYRWLLYFGK